MFLDIVLDNMKNKSKEIAYVESEHKYSYNELYKYVCNIYEYIRKQELSNKYVVVYGSKEIYMKSCFLACSFAGITYIPIDKTTPKDRVNDIIEQINPSLIIGDLEYDNINNISTIEIYNIINKDNYQDIQKIYIKPNDIYYIIFTSGSTGIPKGVKVTYENLDSCIKWLEDTLNLKNEIILNQANFSFDLSVADLYLSVINGNSQYIINISKMFEFEKICNSVKQSNVSCAVVTPSFIDLLLMDNEFCSKNLPNLKTILFCGEPLIKSTVEKIYSRFKDIRIINCYGPTECTFAVTSIEISKDILRDGLLPVGKPKNDVKIYILDENGNNLPDGNVGEILISGKSVANGYIGNVNNNSFRIYNNKKSYLTGDLGYIKDGILYCVGRKDEQVKYKGYRIELSDIEQNLYKLEYIEKVKVIASKNENNIVNKIIAFIQLKENIKKNSLDVRGDIYNFLPTYMVPNIKIIDRFKLNKNGKIDIQELRRIVDGR